MPTAFSSPSPAGYNARRNNYEEGLYALVGYCISGVVAYRSPLDPSSSKSKRIFADRDFLTLEQVSETKTFRLAFRLREEYSRPFLYIPLSMISAGTSFRVASPKGLEKTIYEFFLDEPLFEDYLERVIIFMNRADSVYMNKWFVGAWNYSDDTELTAFTSPFRLLRTNASYDVSTDDEDENDQNADN